MLKNFVTLAIRQLLKNKIFSLVNILGLTIGLSCFTIIVLHVENEFSYDRFHKNPEDIYRVVKDFVNADGTAIPDAMTPPALSTAMRAELPEVDQVTRFSPGGGRLYLLEHNDKRFYETRLLRVDPYFFEVFDFSFALGDKTKALADLHAIVLTESVARKYFGQDNPLGKIIRINLNNGTDYTVTGVLHDLPSQSHFHFDFLIPFESRRNPDTDWAWNGFYTYARLKPGSDARKFESATVSLFKKHQPDNPNRIYIQPLTNIHLRSDLKWELGANGNIDRIIVMMLIAVFIILLAGINYVNLSTAQSSRRAREVGVRKVSGALRHSLIFQFLCESFVIVATSIACAVVATELLLPLAPSILGSELTYTFKDSHYVWIVVPGCAFIIAFGAGLYPAFYLSSFKPVLALKGNSLQAPGGASLRKTMVICQFAISTTLVIGSLTITKQLEFMNHQNKGFNAEDVMTLPNVRGGIGRTVVDNDAMLHAMLRVAGVERIGRADGILGSTNAVNGVSVRGQNHTVLNFIRADYEYIPAMQMEIVAGRNFSNEFTSDSTAIILNETAVGQLGLTTNSIGQQILWDDQGTTHEVTLVGIVKDFHFRSLRETIKPFGFILEVGNGSNFFVRINAADQKRTITQLKDVWHRFGPERPFEYFFQDEPLAQAHREEGKFKKLVSAFAVIAISIACLGLFGLISYLTEIKTKEIGIRKAMGATVGQLIRLMSADFLRLIVVAQVIAFAISWYVMNQWLETFAYRTDFDFRIPLVAGASVLIASIITIGYQVIRAALSNPVDSLRSE
ncbi:MAG TPA: ABC transporter permease [Chryseolinea sp.]|nr:ABC transporter permease [Chryseolinea sp.]